MVIRLVFFTGTMLARLFHLNLKATVERGKGSGGGKMTTQERSLFLPRVGYFFLERVLIGLLQVFD